jgi:hypothetical protein
VLLHLDGLSAGKAKNAKSLRKAKKEAVDIASFKGLYALLNSQQNLPCW